MQRSGSRLSVILLACMALTGGLLAYPRHAWAQG